MSDRNKEWIHPSNIHTHKPAQQIKLENHSFHYIYNTKVVGNKFWNSPCRRRVSSFRPAQHNPLSSSVWSSITGAYQYTKKKTPSQSLLGSIRANQWEKSAGSFPHHNGKRRPKRVFPKPFRGQKAGCGNNGRSISSFACLFFYPVIGCPVWILVALRSKSSVKAEEEEKKKRCLTFPPLAWPEEMEREKTGKRRAIGRESL